MHLGAGGNIVLDTPEDGRLAANAIEVGGVHDGFTPLLRHLEHHELPKPLVPHTTVNVIRGLAVAARGYQQLENSTISVDEAEAGLRALGIDPQLPRVSQLASMTVREAQEALN